MIRQSGFLLTEITLEIGGILSPTQKSELHASQPRGILANRASAATALSVSRRQPVPWLSLEIPLERGRHRRLPLVLNAFSEKSPWPDQTTVAEECKLEIHAASVKTLCKQNAPTGGDFTLSHQRNLWPNSLTYLRIVSDRWKLHLVRQFVPIAFQLFKTVNKQKWLRKFANDFSPDERTIHNCARDTIQTDNVRKRKTMAAGLYNFALWRRLSKLFFRLRTQ